jgi:integrase
MKGAEMKRARQQQAGYVFLRCGYWYVRYREDVVLENGVVKHVQKCRRLAQATGEYRTKRPVEQLAERALRPLNDGVVTAESTMSLNRFIESAYFPYAEQQKRRSTYRGYRNIWKRYIKPTGDRALREYRTFECEQMLLSIARREDLCRTTLGHIKHFLSGVFRYARRQGVLDNANPIREVEIPKARPAGETRAYSLEEEVRMLGILPEPAATAVAVAAFTGARKGEIRGFLWEDYDESAIMVKHAVWRSHVDEPKRERSKGPFGHCTVEVLSGQAPSPFGISTHGVHSSKPTRETPKPGCPGKRRDSTGTRSGKATLAWVACLPARLGNQPSSAGSLRQGDPTNPAARECDHHDEHLREDGLAGCHGRHENAGS